MDIEYTCPLGSVCEEIRNNKLHRCRWFAEVKGLHPQTGEEVNQWNCSIPLSLIGILETSRTNRGQTAALESFRNEVVQGNNQLLAIAQTKNNRILSG